EAEAVGGLGRLARCAHALRRMIALEDSQIMVASCVVAGRAEGPIQCRREANWYLHRLYGLYGWGHLRYAVQMLLRTVKLRPTRPVAFLCTLSLWLGIKLRRASAGCQLRWFPPSTRQ